MNQTGSDKVHPMHALSAELLEQWCRSLLKLQVTHIRTEGLYGGILCPACSRIHGRSADAIYPMMHMARRTGDRGFLDAACRLFEWSGHVSLPDGSMINDTSSDWKGITVFAAIQLGDAIRHHGDLLDTRTLQQWKERLRQMADFLYGFVHMETGNINYPVTCAAAMAIAGVVLDEPRYLRRSRVLAHGTLNYFTPGLLLYGEGKPADQRSPLGCLPVDLGYNVEESLPGLVTYAMVTGDEMVLQFVTESMKSHLNFMLPDGAWDNSWGSRSYKWTYWGSRTSDGCQPAYALLADREPVFAEAAYRNLQLLQSCTHDGLLYGGPHYHHRGELPCVHHTFCHAKALATVLDHPEAVRPEEAVRLPSEVFSGVRYHPDIATLQVGSGRLRATVTAYDWEYCRGGHPSGGTISMLWHPDAGVLLCGSQTDYRQTRLTEPDNMQIPGDFSHQCLTPRLEQTRRGVLLSQMFATDALMHTTEGPDGIRVTAEGRLAGVRPEDTGDAMADYRLHYHFEQETLTLKVEMPDADDSVLTWLHLPVIAKQQEMVTFVSDNVMLVQKPGCQVRWTVSTRWETDREHPERRIFSLVPGFEAVPVGVALRGNEAIRIQIRTEKTE